MVAPGATGGRKTCDLISGWKLRGSASHTSQILTLKLSAYFLLTMSSFNKGDLSSQPMSLGQYLATPTGATRTDGFKSTRKNEKTPCG